MDLLIIGGSTHGLTAYAVAQRLNRYSSVRFCDDRDPSLLPLTVQSRYWGCVGDLLINFEQPSEIFVAIGKNSHRRQIVEKLRKMGLDQRLTTLIDPQAVLMGDVKIATGSLIMPGSIIGPDTSLGEAIIVGAHAFIGASCSIGAFSNICPSVCIGASTSIGEEAFIGMGARILQDLAIAAKATVGAGAVATDSIEFAGTFVGIPAREVQSEL